MTDIEHILSERGQAAMKITGWPEWKYRRWRERLERDDPGWRCYSRMGAFQGVEPMADEVALSLIERHWRVWLIKQRADLEIEFCPEIGTLIVDGGIGATIGSGDTYISALIAAILAVGGE